jgi:hypothetical protein
MPYILRRFTMIDMITILLAINQVQQEALQLAESKIIVQEELLAIVGSQLQDRDAVILELESILDDALGIHPHPADEEASPGWNRPR